MSCAAEMSIRPTTPAELPTIAHVTDREDRRRKQPPDPADKKNRRHASDDADGTEAKLPHPAEDGQSSEIDLLA